jgi:FtsP/CotA-like multicopper oxidase with cupredoxin domain
MTGRPKQKGMDMRALASARIGVLTVALVAAGVITAGSAAAAPVTIELCAVPGATAPLPTTSPGVTVPIWGFGIPSTLGDCGTATVTVPGPVLSVNEGDVVSLTINNRLPAGHPISVDIPGVAFDPGPAEAPVGGSVTRTFTAAAGTYLYTSAADAGRQQAMGLYGLLIVRPATANQAYAPATTAFDVEAPMVLSVLDPAFNNSPETADLLTYRATWWLINGRSYPDTQPITAASGQRVLLRYANGGFDNTSMALLGGHQRVLARDAMLLTTVLDAAADTIPAGATEDTVFTVPSGPGPSSHGYAVYNRQLHVSNGAQLAAGPAPATGGGMLTFIGP